MILLNKTLGNVFSDPSKYYEAILGAIFGALIPSLVKLIGNVIRWYKLKNHWIVGSWNMYYFNFEELRLKPYCEKWLISKTLTRFKVISNAIEHSDKSKELVYKGKMLEERNCVLFYLSSTKTGLKDRLFLRFHTGYFKQGHTMIGFSNSLDWDADASIHVAILSQELLSEDQIVERVNRYVISQDKFAMKIHQKYE